MTEGWGVEAVMALVFGRLGRGDADLSWVGVLGGRLALGFGVKPALDRMHQRCCACSRQCRDSENTTLPVQGFADFGLDGSCVLDHVELVQNQPTRLGRELTTISLEFLTD